MQINEDTLSYASFSLVEGHQRVLIVLAVMSLATGLCRSLTRSRTRTCTRARGPRGCLYMVRQPSSSRPIFDQRLRRSVLSRSQPS